MARSNSYKTMLLLSIVDAIGNGHPDRIGGKIVIIHGIGIPIPGNARIFKIADFLFFLRIYADDGISCRSEYFSFPVDVFELPVSHLSWRRVLVAGFQILLIDT